MHTSTVLTLFLSCMAVPSAWASHGLGSSHSRSHARHAAAVEEREDTSLRLINRNQTLVKRDQFNNAKFSNFVAGPGACGGTYKASDFIVALNIPQWDNGGNCFKTITIQYQGRSTQAQIVDECTGCPEGGLDLTAGLFEFLVPGPDSIDIVGIVYGSWSFGAGDGGSSTTTTSSQQLKTSTTAAPPPPTSTMSSTTTTTSTSTTTSTTKSSSSSTKAAATTSSTTSSTSSSTSSSTTLSTTTSSTVTRSSTLSASSTLPISQTQLSPPSASAVSVLENLAQAYLQLGAVVAAHAAGGK